MARAPLRKKIMKKRPEGRFFLCRGIVPNTYFVAFVPRKGGSANRFGGEKIEIV